MLHGITLVAERAALLKWLGRLPLLLQRLYAIVFVVAGWILFRSETFAQAAGYFRAMANPRGWMTFERSQLDLVISAEGWLAVAVGILAATPLLRWLAERILVKRADDGWSARPLGAVVLMSLLLLSAMKLASGSFNPFIYYRF
jgi:alginate O-acetyltransferase complex protein AlgI